MVEDGLLAVDATLKESFDLVLMDIEMPRMGGIEAVRKIRESGAGEVPVVALTAHASGTILDACLEAGMSDILTKPIKAKVLNAMIRKHCRPRNPIDLSRRS